MSLGLEFVVRRDAEVSDRIRELPQRGSERKTDRPEGQQRGREAARLARSHQQAQDQAVVVEGGPQWVPDLHLVHPAYRHAATAMSFKRRPTSCRRSISTASDPCRTLGHNKAVRRSDSERLRADAGKTSLQRGKQAFREPVLGPARREHAAHESLISRPMLAEVRLAGLSSGLASRGVDERGQRLVRNTTFEDAHHG